MPVPVCNFPFWFHQIGSVFAPKRMYCPAYDQTPTNAITVCCKNVWVSKAGKTTNEFILSVHLNYQFIARFSFHVKTLWQLHRKTNAFNKLCLEHCPETKLCTDGVVLSFLTHCTYPNHHRWLRTPFQNGFLCYEQMVRTSNNSPYSLLGRPLSCLSHQHSDLAHIWCTKSHTLFSFRHVWVCLCGQCWLSFHGHHTLPTYHFLLITMWIQI